MALNISGCDSCFDLDKDARPPPWQFNAYLPWFLNSTVTGVIQSITLPDNSNTPTKSCKLTGQAYPADVIYDAQGNITMTRLRLYHSGMLESCCEFCLTTLSCLVLKTQEDFINALKVAYAVADQSPVPIYPYSVFYIYFEQYLYITSIAIQDSLFALGRFLPLTRKVKMINSCWHKAGVFLVTLLLLQDPWMSVLITGSVAMVELDLLGLMYLWDISLNAISVVNLVMCIGIAVEFHTHIAHAFLQSPFNTRTARATDALVEMGSSVFSGTSHFLLLQLSNIPPGITLTKFFGVVVLAFSASDIFKVHSPRQKLQYNNPRLQVYY